VLLVMGAGIAIVGMGRRGALRMSGETLVTVLVLWAALVATNAWVSVPLGGILASLAGSAAVLLMARLRGGPIAAMRRDTVRSLQPYILLIGAMLAMTSLSALVDLGPAAGVLTSPALWLLVSAASAPLLLGIGKTDAATSMRSGLRLFWPVCALTVLFIVFGGLLAANGMSTVLAQGAATLGGGFLLVVPVIGLIGGYVTTSNTATAAMFAAGVTDATVALGANPLVALGAQNVATGAGVMISPSRVALAVSVAEGLRRGDDAPVDAVRVVKTALIANGAVLALLAPLTLLLAQITG